MRKQPVFQRRLVQDVVGVQSLAHHLEIKTEIAGPQPVKILPVAVKLAQAARAGAPDRSGRILLIGSMTSNCASLSSRLSSRMLCSEKVTWYMVVKWSRT